jgi:hypothetical protein
MFIGTKNNGGFLIMNIEICPVCGIKRENDQFFWGVTGNNPASNDGVHSRVCKIAKLKGKNTSKCINPSDGYNEAKGWSELPSEIRSEVNG